MTDADTIQSLISTLKSMPTGRELALDYQLLVKRILISLFHPPLEEPEYELSGNDNADRRDIIFENVGRTGFWADIRDRYQGEYLVFDAKNLGTGLGIQEVLSLAHYLKPYGCGMFGGLVIRGTEDRGGFYARREQWISQRKMIIVLNDNDIMEMFDRKRKGQGVSYYIAKKVAEFRMSL